MGLYLIYDDKNLEGVKGSGSYEFGNYHKIGDYFPVKEDISVLVSGLQIKSNKPTTLRVYNGDSELIFKSVHKLEHILNFNPYMPIRDTTERLMYELINEDPDQVRLNDIEYIHDQLESRNITFEQYLPKIRTLIVIDHKIVARRTIDESMIQIFKQNYKPIKGM